jgi:outer membrane protein TolC
MIDPVALLRLGQRGAALDLTKAREGEALAALAAARWQLVGRIAELFAAHTALARLQPLQFQVDIQAFATAGLASPNAIAQASAAMAGATAERVALEAERWALLGELRQSIGVPATVPLVLVPLEPAFPEPPAATEAALLARPDLAISHARYEVAEAEFARACADQYPSLQIGPDLPLGARGIEGMAWFKIPLDAAGPAHAARERRIAARAELVAAYLAASNEVASAELNAAATAARQAAAAAAAEASANAAAAAQAALAVEVDVFERFGERAATAVRDLTERRGAEVVAARARVRLATARGWPLAQEVQ